MNYNNLEVKTFTLKMVDEVVDIWNKDVYKNSLCDKFDKETFINKIINNEYFDEEGFIVLLDNNKVIAFGHALATYDNKKTPGFISFIVVKEEYQRKGIGSYLLSLLEKYLKTRNKTFIRMIFTNPINLKWIIPQTNNHYHANMPGVPYNSSWYLFLLNNGFNINGQNQDTYYQDISDFEYSDKIIKRLEKVNNEGYFITFYDDEKHFGFKELFEALNNPSWHNVVKKNLAKDIPDPMLVIVKDNEILGWTGPLVTTSDKRGSFAGIGVHPKAGGKGLGSLLFNKLVMESKNNKADYMTLFTGSENVARNIYLNAGFKIVQSFAILRKDLYK